jgi:hypothetical protein
LFAQHLKNRFGKGYQVEMKIKHVSNEDDDVSSTTARIFQYMDAFRGEHTQDAEESDMLALASKTYIHLDRVKSVCNHLTGDDYLSNMIGPNDPHGFPIFKLANSPTGVNVYELVVFCVDELRMRSLVSFFEQSYLSSVLRERQEVKVRFEISSDGLSISSVFALIESHREELMVEDFSVSQTSLEQVFNIHAAKAEMAKQNTVDGGSIQRHDYVNTLSGNETHSINMSSLHSSSFLEEA